MNKSLSETLVLARRWEKKAAKINGIVLTNSSEFVIKFAGHISVRDEGIVLTSGDDFEFRLGVVPTMAFMYENAVLEIRASGYRCILYEPIS